MGSPRRSLVGELSQRYVILTAGQKNGTGVEGGMSQVARSEALRDTRGRFEQWAQNPACEANTVSAVHNVPMRDVAKAENLDFTFGQSPFAIARGNQFEAGLFRDGAQVLRKALAESGVLSNDKARFVDLRLRINGGDSFSSLDAAIAETTDLLTQAAAGLDQAILAAGPTVRIPKGVMLPEAVLIIDVLVLLPSTQPAARAVVGEVKAYPDRGGHTDVDKLATARAQAGIYVHALDLTAAQLGIGEELEVGREGFLVLIRTGSNQPSIRAREDLAWQAERARRGFELLEQAALRLPTTLGRSSDQLVGVVRSASTSYRPSCLSFCDRARGCRQAAERAGDPAVIGEDVKRYLGPVSLTRVRELREGGEPRDDFEGSLVEALMRMPS